jgi:hypothetical protein
MKCINIIKTSRLIMCFYILRGLKKIWATPWASQSGQGHVSAPTYGLLYLFCVTYDRYELWCGRTISVELYGLIYDGAIGKKCYRKIRCKSGEDDAPKSRICGNNL